MSRFKRQMAAAMCDEALARIFDLVCRSYARGTARKCVVPYCECLVSKGRWQLQCAMITEEDNDTPVQSQPCRDAGSRNEGGSVRTTEGSDTRETALPAVA